VQRSDRLRGVVHLPKSALARENTKHRKGGGGGEKTGNYPSWGKIRREGGFKRFVVNRNGLWANGRPALDKKRVNGANKPQPKKQKNKKKKKTQKPKTGVLGGERNRQLGWKKMFRYGNLRTNDQLKETGGELFKKDGSEKEENGKGRGVGYDEGKLRFDSQISRSLSDFRRGGVSGKQKRAVVGGCGGGGGENIKTKNSVKGGNEYIS